PVSAETGPDICLTKPFTPGELAERIVETLSRWREIRLDRATLDQFADLEPASVGVDRARMRPDLVACEQPASMAVNESTSPTSFWPKSGDALHLPAVHESNTNFP